MTNEKLKTKLNFSSMLISADFLRVADSQTLLEEKPL